MHQAFLVTEVLLDVFRHLDKNPDPARKSSLSALARTCKTFHEPAMDLLWATLDGVTPMLGCVPRLHQLIYCHGRVSRHIRDWSHSVGPLSEAEARQFLRHAARVRSMITSCEHVHLYSVLPLETCVFPGLLSLVVTAYHHSQNKYLYLFLSPTLRRCFLIHVPDLKSIATHCPALEDLRITDAADSTAEELALLFDSIRLCKRLVTLSCPPFDWATWKDLSNLPSLLKVYVRGPPHRTPTLPFDRTMVNLAPFINVTNLFFDVGTTAYVISVMQHSEFPSLKQFRMAVDVLPWAEAEQLFRALSQCKATQTLEHVSILSFGPGLQESSNNSLTVIPYFLSFTQLRFLHLQLHFCIHLDNDRLLEAISSWRNIHILLLMGPAMPPAITFRGLFAALRLCPHLHKLGILMDAVNIDIDPKDESFQHTTLQTLDVTHSEIADAEAVARIIFSTLPCVHRIMQQHNGDAGMRFRKLWDEVNGHLKVLMAPISKSSV
ncbi:hypothetical protein DEU56DRAFT_544628 [Suillus clintonianus]|uniref:uncharacterized protein n=1 Tax=Suillus clintonianus TaxID=1904413 RepID=UPI001B85DAD5|nr:uncharacterized protein DEU56DRAFT_544628 [Suillus clintonianus]KAG2151299.1 hypothetical protein DEU56DRAFT_544628 [Suillus clintonianus]